MSLGRGLMVGVVTLGGALALGLLSRQAVPWEPDDASVLRLTWRVRGAELGECRRATPEELERLPVHMRNPDACAGPTPSFRLSVVVDGRTLVDEEVAGAGARGDRPIYVFRELRVPPGERALEVVFARTEPVEGEGLQTLRLDTRVSLAPREVLLVTHEGETGRGLELRRPR